LAQNKTSLGEINGVLILVGSSNRRRISGLFRSCKELQEGATQKSCTIFYDFIAFLSPERPERALNKSPGKRPG